MKFKNILRKVFNKDNYNLIKSFVLNNKYLLFVSLPFILMEFFTFLFAIKINFVNYKIYAPILFTLCYIILFVGLTMSFKGFISKIIYLTFNFIFLIMFLVNNVYFSMTDTFFDFNLLESAGEGAPYMLDALKNCNVFVYIAFIVIIISLVYGFKSIPRIKKTNFKLVGITLIVFVVLHFITPYTLGKVSNDLTWSTWRNARKIYISFNDNNKSIKITGLYEYTIRNFYMTFLKPNEKITEEDVEFLDGAFSLGSEHKNNYTGQLKDKNLIIVQLEGMDSWLINKHDTPTLYSMMNNSINFTKHYSYYNGGGSTFNSEFAINTGLITPLSYNKNAYSFNRNTFPYTLSKLFKNEGYVVNAFHMNTGEYYSRTTNYLNWGYDNYYGLKDMADYSGDTYMLDRELILNEQFNELLFPNDTKFVDYLITYSGHLPFTNKKGVCKMLYNMDNEELKTENPDLEFEFVQMTEEECIRRQAQETDYMMQLLIENLEEKELLDNTVIVAVTDHYLYTISDQTILDRYKNTSNNLINNTPLFIWGKGIKKTNVNKVTSQLNVLPTILNLFGIQYNINNYIGEDALDKNYNGIVFFSDYSWYDGNVYVENGEVTNNKKISSEKLEEKNNYIKYITKKNDLVLRYNYFKGIKNNAK